PPSRKVRLMLVRADTPCDARAEDATVRETPEGFAPPGASLYGASKPVLDFVLALGILILTAPVLLLAALAIKLTSRRPVIYSHTRRGRHGRPYRIFKLRTMTHNCELQSGVRWSTAGDPRVTPVGRFLRRTHIDELPQLWNVLLGDMSLV